MPKTINVLLIVILLGYGLGITIYQRKTLTDNRVLKSRLENLNEINARAKAELDRLNSERAKIEQESERMKADSLTYLKQQTMLQDKIDKLKEEISSNRSKVKTLSADLARAEQEATKLRQEQQKTSRNKESELKSKEEEVARIKSELARAKQASDKKEASFHYNLGVIYTEAGRYDDAVSEYDKALRLNPNFSNVYYNLGIIYSDYFNDPPKAAYYFQEYLRFQPNALDAEEVQSWISQLQ